MDHSDGGGYVSLSIDAEPIRGRAPRESSDEVLLEILARFNSHRLPATWALGNSGSELLTRRIAASPVGHELAMLADGTLAKAEISRGELANMLSRLGDAAIRAGRPATSLVMNQTWQPRHQEILLKFGISMMRGRTSLPHGLRVISRHGGEGVQTVCYGLWHLPTAATLRGGGWMSNVTQLTLARRAVDRAAATGGVCHLRIDATGIALGDVAIGLRNIDRLLRQLDTLADAGRIRLETLAETAVRLQPRRTLAAARSILRAA